MTDGDLISRQATIEVLNKMDRYVADELTLCDAERKFPKNEVFIIDDVYEEIVERLPSVTPQPKTARWIPVSERLPEEFQRVLVTIVNYKGDKVVRVAEYYNRKDVGVFQIKENHEQWEVGEKGLLAWMSLPNPYKESEE